MDYIYAALLLHSAGKKINEEDVTKILHAAGSKVDAARVKALVSALEGVKIDEALKHAAMPVAVAAAPAGAAPAAGAKKEEKKEEKKTEEEAAAGLASLFG